MARTVLVSHCGKSILAVRPFARMMEGLSSAGTEHKTVMIDATYLKAHRTASSLAVKRGISGA